MMVSGEVCFLKITGTFFAQFVFFSSINMALFGRGRGTKMSDVRGFKPGVLARYSRYDNNFFAVLGEHDEDTAQEGGMSGMSGMFTSFGDNKDDGFTVVRGKQSSKRQRISSGGQSGQAD